MKKKVYIISHSHWDREWYMPYEQHHMRLIELMDDLLEVIDTDPEFDSFHLDGHTLPIDDYLEVRPERKEAVQAAITAGKLRIGPFYILQDAFLTSSESNTRNMLIGMKESKKWGEPVELGYFPDTFGNMGQTPQMMKLANLQAAAFGRGVKPIGFDNEVLADDNYTSQYSEMYWDGPDGTQIFGLLFANWYSNGNEIPTTEKEAREYWEQKLADVEKYASTNHLLMMNGVDHQPVQKDITKAIRLANELYPEYEFIHSNFPDYLAAVEADLPQDLGHVSGELTSQETDGWFTLANTSSARVYLKQWNTRVSRQLENIAEPLAAMAYELTGDYPHDQLDYAWKTLMQNHPHDSICGCSVDEVHREMMPRFEKAYEVGKYVADEALARLSRAIDVAEFPEASLPFVIFNTAGVKKSGMATVDIEVNRVLFKELYPSDGYEKLASEVAKTYVVVSRQGEVVPAIISEEKIRFDYELPKDGFRIPYMEKYVTVSIEVDQLSEFSWETFALIEAEAEQLPQKLVHDEGRVLENDHVKVTVESDGSLTLLNKEMNQEVRGLLVFEDTGDIANEYIYRQPENDQALLSTQFSHKVEIIENNALQGKIRLTHLMEIPVSADELLDLEQRMVVDFRYRKAQRSKETMLYPVETIVTIQRLNAHIQFETKVNNQAKDHRLRVLFPTQLEVTTHEADSIYEAVKRPNTVSMHWENPTNPQHQHAFVNMHGETYGLTVNNFGLNEYEIEKETIAVTLLRSVGELGDWGYFATPEAQCLGEHHFVYGVTLHGAPETRFETYRQAQANQFDFVTTQVRSEETKLASAGQYLGFTNPTFAATALKRGADNELIFRGYNLSENEQPLGLVKGDNCQFTTLNLLEEELEAYEEIIKPYEIRTVRIEG